MTPPPGSTCTVTGVVSALQQKYRDKKQWSIQHRRKKVQKMKWGDCYKSQTNEGIRVIVLEK